MSTVISSGDTSFSASAGKRLFVRSNAYENIIPDKYESISFWTTSHRTSARKYDAGHEKTMFAWSGRRPMLLGSIESNANSPKSGSSASITLSTKLIVSFNALSVGSSATATSATKQKENTTLIYRPGTSITCSKPFVGYDVGEHASLFGNGNASLNEIGIEIRSAMVDTVILL